MKPPTRLVFRIAPSRTLLPRTSNTTTLPSRHLHTSTPAPATVASLHGTGPPPEPPVPASDSTNQRLERRKRQAALLLAAGEIRAAHKNTSRAASAAPAKEYAPMRKRFWKDVHVREVDGAYEVHLDARPLRHPTTKHVVRLPPSKPLLAAALAHEWDMLVSIKQASRQHLVPLTSLVCRAIDIAADDAAPRPEGVAETIRAGIARTLMRYLDTDSLLCWAPPPGKFDLVPGQESLREVQQRTAEKIVAFLTTRVWPGAELVPVLDTESIVPKSQDAGTRKIIEGWVMGLSAWELAGLEKGVLAGKGLLGAVRLLVEWTEGFVGVGISEGSEKKFGVEEAAKVASMEVDWQTGNWGEVEDTHDVEKEDVRRQFGSVVLIVSGTGKK